MQQPGLKESENAVALLGDCHPLLEQLGSTEGLVTLASAAGVLRVPQGLINYARNALTGFVHAAGRTLALSETFCRKLVESLCEDIPQRLEALLNKDKVQGFHSV